MQTKIRLIKALIWPIATYSHESWTLGKGMRNRLDAFEMWTLRRMLRISWQEHRTNESILQQCRITRQLLRNILRGQLKYFGHIRRKQDSLEKIVMEGRVEGKRGKGRPLNSLSGNMKMWSGKGLVELAALAQNRSRWREFVNALEPPRG